MSKDAIMAAPPVGVGGLTLWGIHLNEWVLIGTLIYTVFLIVDKFPSVVQRMRELRAWIKKRRKQ